MATGSLAGKRLIELALNLLPGAALARLIGREVAHLALHGTRSE